MERVVFDFRELRGRIVARFGTCKAFAEAAHVSRAQLSDRLGNKVRFAPDDICLFSELLDIPSSEIGKYFFTPKV